MICHWSWSVRDKNQLYHEGNDDLEILSRGNSKCFNVWSSNAVRLGCGGDHRDRVGQI